MQYTWDCPLYSKTCLKLPLKKDKKTILMTNGSLMKVKRITECSPWSILQYFWPALSDNWSWKTIFGLFESGGFTQVLLYILRGHRLKFPKILKIDFASAKSVEPDEMPHYAAFHLAFTVSKSTIVTTFSTVGKLKYFLFNSYLVL